MQSPSNAQLKRWSKLGRRKHRESEGLFLAEGVRCVTQILNNGVITVEALILRFGDDVPELISGTTNSADDAGPGRESPKGDRMDNEVRIGHRMKPELYSLDPPDFNRLADTETPQGILAVCRIPDPLSIEVLSEGSGLIVAMDAIQDPGNFGTMVRTSAWFGVQGILAGSGCVDPWNPKVIRSTAGATGVVPVVGGELSRLIGECNDAGWKILLLDGSDDSEPIAGIEAGDRTLIVVGNEGRGIQKSLYRPGWRSVRISSAGSPKRQGAVESLNAATALGIALFAASH